MKIVLSDIDGTLLHHLTYDWKGTDRAIRQLADGGIPVFMNSSKTVREQQHLQTELGLFFPFLAENGSLLAIPDGWNLTPSTWQKKPESWQIQSAVPPEFPLRQCIDDLKTRIKESFLVLSEAPVSTLQQKIRLDVKAIQRAQIRQFTETLIFTGEKPSSDEITKIISKYDAVAETGTRFITIRHRLAGKGTSVDLVKNWFETTFSLTPEIIAIGDGFNDLEMIYRSDRGFWVGKQHQLSGYPPHVTVCEETGPAGFIRMAETLLAER